MKCSDQYEGGLAQAEVTEHSAPAALERTGQIKPGTALHSWAADPAVYCMRNIIAKANCSACQFYLVEPGSVTARCLSRRQKNPKYVKDLLKEALREEDCKAVLRTETSALKTDRVHCMLGHQRDRPFP